MAIPVKLEAFEGPLDLLLHLIEKNKIDIYDIPIVEITEQYLDYIKQMETDDMNVMSEFLVMAATLIDIKCRMLLPKEVDEEGVEEDPRAELVQKLLEYKMYKYMSLELRDRQVDAAKSLYREQKLPPEVALYKPPLDYEQLIGDMTLNRLSSSARYLQSDHPAAGGQDRPHPQPVRQYRKRRDRHGRQDALCGGLCPGTRTFQLPQAPGEAVQQNGDHRHVPGRPGTDEDQQDHYHTGADF